MQITHNNIHSTSNVLPPPLDIEQSTANLFIVYNINNKQNLEPLHAIWQKIKIISTNIFSINIHIKEENPEKNIPKKEDKNWKEKEGKIISW